jgi:hypothetical protein
MNVFDQKGKFTPLSDDEVARLTPVQVGVYNELVAAVHALADADAAAETAAADCRDAVAALAEAERNEPPPMTPLDVWKAVKETRRIDRGF